ncbi:Aquaporin [Phytophthora megakarya]|uniref:Aquaporin n=1 Tax=Phytophthora megakarya TaxID=4795 RepID=A0A225UVP1_9STRA|nr:Aquaporin [Phytophthora megakarya]
MTEYGTNKLEYADLESNTRLPFYNVHNPHFRAYLAEFVGTFILVLIGDGSVAQYVLGGGGAGHYLSVNLCWGIALLFGIHFSGGVSGGHLNPAVTLTLAMFKRFEWHKVPGYFAAQTAGAFAAAMIVFIVYYPWFDIHDPERLTTQGIFATYPNAQIPNWSALANEIIGTALLVSGIFAVGDQLNKPASPYTFPAAVALMLTCIGMAFGLDTGYALNPARDFGPRLFTFFAGWGWQVWTLRDCYFWIPIVGPFVGGILGAATYVGLIEAHHPLQEV